MMVKFKISKDGNEKKYIPLIRKMMNRSLSEIRECLCNNGYIDICGLEDIDRLQHMNKLIEELQKKGAEIILYEDEKILLKHTLIQKGIFRKRTTKLLNRIECFEEDDL